MVYRKHVYVGHLFSDGLSIHDISKPGQMQEIAFLEMPGIGVNRVAWQGGRYAQVAAHFDGFTDRILCVVDLKEITKPEIVARWWLARRHARARIQGLTRCGERTLVALKYA